MRVLVVVLSGDTVLFFEFFPAFVALVGVIAAILLYVKDRQARENNEPEEPVTPRDASRKDDDGRALRPSMRA
jgi:uncharacterized MAPEG superfamily protein